MVWASVYSSAATPQRHRCDEQRDGCSEAPPVRMQVDDHRLVIVQQSPRVRHDVHRTSVATARSDARSGPRVTPRAVTRTRSRSIAKPSIANTSNSPTSVGTRSPTLGDLVERGDHVSGERVPVALGQRHAHAAPRTGRRAACPARRTCRPASCSTLARPAVGFVVELADQFLDHVLERDDADDGAVFVDDQRDVLAIGAHLEQQVFEPVVLGRHHDRPGHRTAPRSWSTIRRAVAAGP